MAFKAFLIDQEKIDGKTRCSGRFVQYEEAALDAGEVTIQVAYSSVNYKDALAATGAGSIIRRFPCIGGIDLAGTVIASSDSRFKSGDAVIATSFDIGVAHHGGFAEIARLPADWVIKLPNGLSFQEAMALGTAGFTAGLAILRLEQMGLSAKDGPVIVSGASGGVGSIAINILAQRGYEVCALTGKENESDYLKGLGAQKVLLRQSLDLARIKPLSSETWAAGIDNLGGEMLAWMLSATKRDGSVASIGLASSHLLNTTVMPFILRGVNLLGIDSGFCPMPVRNEVWRRLAAEDKPKHLNKMTREIPFSQLPNIFDDYLQARISGRVVVKI